MRERVVKYFYSILFIQSVCLSNYLDALTCPLSTCKVFPQIYVHKYTLFMQASQLFSSLQDFGHRQSSFLASQGAYAKHPPAKSSNPQRGARWENRKKKHHHIELHMPCMVVAHAPKPNDMAPVVRQVYRSTQLPIPTQLSQRQHMYLRSTSTMSVHRPSEHTSILPSSPLSLMLQPL